MQMKYILKALSRLSENPCLNSHMQLSPQLGEVPETLTNAWNFCLDEQWLIRTWDRCEALDGYQELDFEAQ